MGRYLDYARNSGEVVPNATETEDGFMSAADKTALDQVVSGAGAGLINLLVGDGSAGDYVAVNGMYLTYPIYSKSFLVNPGITVYAAGWIAAKGGDITNNGTIYVFPLSSGSSGGSGANSPGYIQGPTFGGMNGAGGAGGSDGSNPGQSGGASNMETFIWSARSLFSVMTFGALLDTAPYPSTNTGGAGGGSGAGNSPGNGGAGGAGGGVLMMLTDGRFLGSGSVIAGGSNGQNGGAASSDNSGGGGGGGGGAGGFVFMAGRSIAGTLHFSADGGVGGLGGAGHGAGSAGATGEAGKIGQIIFLNLYTAAVTVISDNDPLT
jgi:hypothetical protein